MADQNTAPGRSALVGALGVRYDAAEGSAPIMMKQRLGTAERGDLRADLALTLGDPKVHIRVERDGAAHSTWLIPLAGLVDAVLDTIDIEQIETEQAPDTDG